MEYIKFDTEEAAIAFIDKVNKGEGIPVSEDAVTKTYCDYTIEEDKYLIIKDEITSKYELDSE
jgi:hypothetical protein